MSIPSTVGAPTVGLPVRVALIGMGRMGHALDALAPERGCTVVARLDAAEMSNGITAADLHGAQVAIEFTTPESSVANAIVLLGVRCPVVIGTTGWSAQLPAVEAAAREAQCAALWSPNFSIGVQLFLAMAEDAAQRARQVSGFDAHVVETHHMAKLDAPSGTGIAIADRLREGLGREVPITSVRTGSVPGTHEIIFDAPFEQIRLVHEARDRRVFADGALTAARWLAGARAPGVYTMRDVLASSQAMS
ncbi:dihydrodipicolinate reductase C-terminal domain-containing protein [Gemmatimonas sp.]|uniref:4-hydroxy-tetrahydrodipicolinate reductase n=1 Tax=Gemmatimonas sp. TaxID=1962908 RepID=UPI00286B6BAF|nr:dihydrodipicolinate reductase C-terminal domain-containing protein [Gemmatimonas sp.]